MPHGIWSGPLADVTLPLVARLWAYAAVACLSAGCSLDKHGSGDDMALVGDSTSQDVDLPIDTSIAVDTSVMPVDTAEPEDSRADVEADAVAVDSADTAPVDTGTDAGPDIPIVCTTVADKTTVDLTAIGTVFWGHYGHTTATSYDHKSGPELIPPVSVVGSYNRYNFFEVSFSWSDGTPTAASASEATGLYTAADGAAFNLKVPGDGSVRTLRLYLRTYAGSAGTLTAAIGDTKSGSMKLSTTKTTTFACDVVFSTSSTLDVSFVKNSGVVVSIQSIALF